MKLTNDYLFGMAWRATLFLLPWQTRLILSTAELNGFPWEQGTLAIYLSWMPLIATVILAWGRLKERATKQPLRATVAVPVGILILATLLTSSWSASFLFIAHIVLLVLFVAALNARSVPFTKAMHWFLFSLIPHALLGIAQFAAQHVWGSTLLGIAEQISWTRGVSVVEYGEYRVLRAYGGFPHPNLFGGWLAAALLFLPEIIRQAKTALTKFAWIGTGVLFLYTLILTFSRGAWIAAAVGLALAFVLAFRRTETKHQREALILAVVLFLAAISIAVITQWPTVATRFQATERLEQWSISQRTTAFQDGIEAFKRHPILGWGPGASLIGIAVARTAPSPVPLEPPHMAPFVLLLETGLLGLIAAVALAWYLLRTLIADKRLIPALPLLATLSLLALTDHYLWTLWAGNALLIVMLGLKSTKEKEI